MYFNQFVQNFFMVASLWLLSKNVCFYFLGFGIYTATKRFELGAPDASVVKWTFKDYNMLALQRTRKKVELSTRQAK